MHSIITMKYPRLIYFSAILTIVSIKWSHAQHSIIQSTETILSRSMGSSILSLIQNGSYLNNPAHLAFLVTNSFSIQGGNYYLIPSLNHSAIHSGVKLSGNDGLTILASMDGSPEFREMLIGIGYGRKIVKNTSVGLRINYIQQNQIEFDDLKALSFDIGIQTKLVKNIWIGFQTKNTIPIKINKHLILPSFYSLGLLYEVNEFFKITTAVQADQEYSPKINIGLLYQVYPKLSLQVGLKTDNISWTTGFSYEWNTHFWIDASMEYQLVLGLSPGIGIHYKWLKS
ncbi:MAG: hypothetical protein M3Q56_00475 [Bacteroidota bacterium]|nr:hypothetical protein [Bacteroidota bacterium]